MRRGSRQRHCSTAVSSGEPVTMPTAISRSPFVPTARWMSTSPISMLAGRLENPWTGPLLASQARKRATGRLMRGSALVPLLTSQKAIARLYVDRVPYVGRPCRGAARLRRDGARRMPVVGVWTVLIFSTSHTSLSGRSAGMYEHGSATTPIDGLGRSCPPCLARDGPAPPTAGPGHVPSVGVGGGRTEPR